MRRDNGHGSEETRTFDGTIGQWIGKPLSRRSDLSSRQQETPRNAKREEKYVILGRPVPSLDGRCRPTGAVEWDLPGCGRQGLARGAP